MILERGKEQFGLYSYIYVNQFLNYMILHMLLSPSIIAHVLG